ncbi:MAG: hypothetical protein RJB38_1619 [Pseudomonadota bacterium]|jgi:DNA polymerase-3 subunit delta
MKLDAKQVQQELKQGLVWPVYWLHGSERFQIRELVNLLRKTVVGEKTWSEERLDGGSLGADDVISAAQSIPFGGGVRFVVVQEAHLIQSPEDLSCLFGARLPLDQASFVVVFIAKDLDARRKFSKVLIERAAVVGCTEIPEEQREAWVRYLGAKWGISAETLPLELLVRSEPWSLEWLDQELAKWALAESAAPGLGRETLAGVGGLGEFPVDAFLTDFLERRNLRGALSWVSVIATKTDVSLPLLGLLAWNVRMAALMAARSPTLRLAPIQQAKLTRMVRGWKLEELQALQKELFELDFALKQTPQEPLALWGVLIQRFCPQA